MDELESVIDGCIAGDQNSWALLVRHCEHDLTRQMWRFSRDSGVCGELVQDVLVELFYSLPRYKRRGVPFEHWLRRVATRVGYRYWKRTRRTSAFGQDAIEKDLPSGAAGPLEAAAASDAARLLHKLLAELRPADRLVLTLMYFEECDISQIAQRTGWNRAVVKMRLMRARRRLRQIVDDRKLNNSLESLSHGQSTMDRATRPASPA